MTEATQVLPMASLHETSPEPLQSVVYGEPPLYRFSVEQFDRLIADGLLEEDDRVELLDGVLVEMTPIGPHHCHANSNLVRALRAMLEPSGWRVEEGWPIVLDGSRPQPDAVVLRDPCDEQAARLPRAADVALVVEVSDKSLETDGKLKARLYAAAGIAQYWIVNVVDRQIEVLQDPAPDDQGTPRYGRREAFTEEVAIVLDGRALGALRLADILPPR
jgi:Uma2 family endonuclease